MSNFIFQIKFKMIELKKKIVNPAGSTLKEKAEWTRERASQEEQLSEEKKQLTKLQEQVKLENADVQLSPDITIVSTSPIQPPLARKRLTYRHRRLLLRLQPDSSSSSHSFRHPLRKLPRSGALKLLSLIWGLF